ncbi:hypothetical protein LAJ19_21605 (plasmid) [Deinococcus taeanensis]|uniref:hypothetical protein n=1 Tax=Deinococcus taeanensis TaxID=2737050 RepID=UPI001CDC359B|nr:hypothetical protein [Deinococcus taeanensis]UBV45522.1 hypothetical protein LAJ19_21605 [Deinococcus taeanensis]
MRFRELSGVLTPNWAYYLTSSGALLKETVSFGVSLGLFTSTADRSWDDRVIGLEPYHPSLALHSLQLLGKQEDPVQRAFRGVHDLLVEQGVFYTSVSDVLERMEVSPLRELFKWNITKVAFWAHFMHDLGLVVRLPPERLILSPASPLLRAQFSEDGPTSGSLRSLLEAWHHDSFAVFTRLGEVHEGLARALLRLESLGELQLSYASDSAGSLLLCGRRVSHFAWLGQPAGDLRQGAAHVDPL